MAANLQSDVEQGGAGLDATHNDYCLPRGITPTLF
jgi:hypothetical protein